MSYNLTDQSQVPTQIQGSQMDIVEQAQCKSAEHTGLIYSVVRRRLLEINNWGKISKLPLSSFKLFNAAGRAVDRLAQEGDFIRIDIPGPGTKTGQGYDWVVVEAIDEEQDKNFASTSMRVRPCAHPLSDEEDIAHFLMPEATSTFQVKVLDSTVFVGEHGRNEMVNVHTKYVLDNIRNAIVGLCAKFGFAYPQWKSLVVGLLEI